MNDESVARRVAFNTAALFAGRVVVTVLGVISFALIAHHLSVRAYGAYSLVLTFIPLLGALTDLGVTTIGVREATRRPEERAQLLGTVLTLRLVVGVLAAGLLVAIAPALPYTAEVKSGLQLAAVGLFFYVLATVPSLLFQTTLRLDRQVIADVSTSIVGLALVATCVLTGLGVHALIGAWATAIAVGCAVSFLLAGRLEPLRPRLDPALTRSVLRMASPLALVLVLSIVHFKSDAILLSLMKPLRAVGIYNYAYRFLEQLLIIPGLFITAVFPVLTAFADRDSERLESTVRKSFTFLFLLGAPASVVLFVLARPIVDVVAGGHRYDAAVVPLRILVFALLFTYLNTLFVNLLIIYDLQARILIVSAAGVAINIGLNVALIPRFSYDGSAAATVATEVASAVVVAVWAIRRARIRLDAGAPLKTVLACAGMAAVMVSTRNLPLAVPLASSALVYLALVAVLRVVTRADLEALLRRSVPPLPVPGPPEPL